MVNAGILAHPETERPALAFVTYGRVKLANLRTGEKRVVNAKFVFVGAGGGARRAR